MPFRPIAALACCWVPALALVLVAHPTARGHERMVPGLNELVIFDPAGHAEGLPPVQFTPSEDGQTMKVNILPTVHVHRYYYSGDKEYQGPIITGGPTVVVANNPHTGKQMYIDVMLPHGSPVIAYDKFSITYVYPDQRVVVWFSCLNHEAAVVKYISGRGLGRELRDAKAKLAEKSQHCSERSKLTGRLKDTARNAGEVAVGAYGVTEWAATTVLETAGKIVKLVPGFQPLVSAGKQRVERSEEQGLRQAGERQQRTVDKFLPTIR